MTGMRCVIALSMCCVAVLSSLDASMDTPTFMRYLSRRYGYSSVLYIASSSSAPSTAVFGDDLGVVEVADFAGLAAGKNMGSHIYDLVVVDGSVASTDNALEFKRVVDQALEKLLPDGTMVVLECTYDSPAPSVCAKLLVFLRHLAELDCAVADFPGSLAIIRHRENTDTLAFSDVELEFTLIAIPTDSQWSSVLRVMSFSSIRDWLDTEMLNKPSRLPLHVLGEHNHRISLHAYHRYYPLYLERLRDQPIRFLEIGLDKGSGTIMWQEYFPHATLYGIDIGDRIDGWDYRGPLSGDGMGEVYIGDQQNVTFLEEVLALSGGNFDLIIDDGGHTPAQQQVSFRFLFHHALKKGGVYIIEDVETSYYNARGQLLYGQQIMAGLHHPNSTIEVFKQLADTVNRKYFDKQYTVMEGVDALVHSVNFGRNNIIVVKKSEEDDKVENEEYVGKNYVVDYRE